MPQAMLLGQDFPSLAARVLYGYLASYPPFVPRALEASEESQAQLHALLRQVLVRCCEEPSIIDAPQAADACFASHWRLNNTNPALIDEIQAVRAKLFALLETLLKVGTLGEARPDGLFIARADWRMGPKLLERLRALGMEGRKADDGVCIQCPAYPAAYPAWRARALHAKPGRYAYVRLLHFLYNADLAQPYTATQLFGKLAGAQDTLAWIDVFFPARGYALDNVPQELRVDYARKYPDKDTGFARVTFRVRDRQQLLYEFRVPQFRGLMAHYDRMPPALQAFCFARMNRCSGCGYCTQTDKSGGRQPLTMVMTWDGVTESKCPLWPGFAWNAMDAEAMAHMEALLRFAERTLHGIE